MLQIKWIIIDTFQLQLCLGARIHVWCVPSSGSYLLNPFTILSCVAKSTCALNNAVIALFFLSTIKGQISRLKPRATYSTTGECVDGKTAERLPLCAGNMLLSAIFLAVATYQSIYPLSLCAPALLYFMQVLNSSSSSSSSSYRTSLDFPEHLWGFMSAQRQYIPVNFRRASFWWFLTQYAFVYLGSLFVIICLSFFLLGSWDYLQSVYGFM